MSASSNRIDKRLFAEVMKKGRNIHSNLATLKFLEAPSGHKFSVSVSKKSYSRAVDRNKLKRRGRAIIRPALQKFPPGSYILFLKKGALGISFIELQERIIELFRKVK